MNQIVVFTLDQLLYGLHLDTVLRVIHAIEIRKLPKAPEIIKGIINVNGQIIPVADIRKRFGFPDKEIEADDQLIITNTGKRQIALLVDSVLNVRTIESKQYINTLSDLPYAEFISGVVKIEDDLILINDLEEFLNIQEEKELGQALSKMSE